jgi:hypothetical protein
LKGHDWRDDLQSLDEAGQTEPRLPADPRAMQSSEWRRAIRELHRFSAKQQKFYLELAADGSFRIPDVPAGGYVLKLTVCEPPDPEAYDPAGNPIIRRPLATLSLSVTVTAGAPGETQDLGTILVPLE